MWCLETLKDLNEKFEEKLKTEATEGELEFEEAQKLQGGKYKD